MRPSAVHVLFWILVLCFCLLSACVSPDEARTPSSGPEQQLRKLDLSTIVTVPIMGSADASAGNGGVSEARRKP